jgi:hypothetical protein
MSLMTDVKSTHLNASGVILAGPGRLAGFSLVGGATLGTISFRDGGASGTVLCEVDIPGNTNVNSFYILVPGTGIRFYTNIYATFTGGLGQCTAFYQA